VLGTVICAALVAVLGLLIQIRKVSDERDRAFELLVRERKQSAAAPAAAPPPAAPAPVVVPEAPVAVSAATPAAASPLPPPAGIRVLPEDPEFLTRGLQDFRRGLYDQAERQFFRALPDSFLYLALTSLAQHNWREAIAFLSRAMGADATWLRRVNPRDLFGKEADYEALLQALDEQVSHAPADPDLKVLTAYLRFHDKGAPYAKALLVEATNASPGHEAAKAFLEALGP
jgi:hypothetical protein